MQQIHIIETEEERATVRRIFAQAARDKAENGGAVMDYNTWGDMISFHDDESTSGIFCRGAVVFDPLTGAVYDFRTVRGDVFSSELIAIALARLPVTI